MESTKKDGSNTIETTSGNHPIYSLAFAEDGRQVLSGDGKGTVRRLRIDDGREVGDPILIDGAEIYAIVPSPDRKWLVCGYRFPGKAGQAMSRAVVWHSQTHEKAFDIDTHTNSVFSVDVSPDSTKFATGSVDTLVFIWNMTTGERLLGPLQHSGTVVTVRFSPTGDRIATATAENPDAKSIRIYDCNNSKVLLEIPFRVLKTVSSPLSWSADGRRLFATSYSEVKCFDASSGSLLSSWTVPGGGSSASIVLSPNQQFVVVAALKSLSFWDTSTYKQIGSVIEHPTKLWSVALSPNGDRIVTGDGNGKVTIRSISDILPVSYLAVNLPFMYISDAVFTSWTKGDLTRAEKLLTEEIAHPCDTSHHARALAHRALVRTRLEQWDLAIDDAKKSIKIWRSVIGYIANAIALVGHGEHESAMRAFDLVFTDAPLNENNFLLLIRAIILFECEKHDSAISRVNGLVDIANDRSLYTAVRAQMCVLLGTMSMQRGDSKRAVELFERAQDEVSVRHGPHLEVVSLIFGWDFEKLSTKLSDLVQECFATFENDGDAVGSKDPKKAIAQYSVALSLNPSNRVSLLVKRGSVKGTLGMWEDALKDADEAIKAEPENVDGHKGRHAALYALRRYDEAMDAFNRMLSLIEGSPDPDIRELRKNFFSRSQLETAIDTVIRGFVKVSPIVLIDVESGRLCDGPKRTHTFKSGPQFKELVCSMTEQLDDKRIQRVVGEYFRYVTLSHVWDGKEPLYQDVILAGSIWDLDKSPLNGKLRRFCEVVRADGYRWAWSDTCCIDKTVSTVLNQSLKMMYKWYEASASTFVFLRDIDSSSSLGAIMKSIWLTRAWTSQELLAPKAIRFYARDWKPYAGNTRPNHKESPEIMQDLANAIGISYETIVSFSPDNLSVREKLRLASTRSATVEEDIAYSLIGIFKSDIRPDYGEGYAALGHLLEEIVARSGDVTVLAWTGKSSAYNSCLPESIIAYSRAPGTSVAVSSAELDVRVSALKDSLSQAEVLPLHERITRLPPAAFANRRLHLPCIIFAVKRLGVEDFGHGHECRYRARASGIGDVEFQTADKLSPKEARKLIFVHPWIRDLRDPLDGFAWGNTGDDEDDDESGSDLESEDGDRAPSPLYIAPSAAMDEYTRALRLVVRLHQPFHALLLQQQPNGDFKRVAADQDIIIPGLDRKVNFTKDVGTAVVEVL